MSKSRRYVLAVATVMVVLFALNMRVTVVNFTPLLADIEREIIIDPLLIGLIGSMPPICFSFFGLITPIVNRKIGMNLNVSFAIVIIGLGHLVRGFAFETIGLLIGVALSMGGMGIANVLMPAIVKKYFPTQIPLMTAVYATLISVSAFVPPLITAATLEETGWRFQMFVYIPLALACLITWLLLVLEKKGSDVHVLEGVSQLTGPIPIITGTHELIKPKAFGLKWKPNKLWSSPSAWALVVAFATSSLSGYSMLTWLPLMLQDIAHFDGPASAVMVSMYSAIGFPAGILIPLIANRMKHPGDLVVVAGICFFIGNLGLLFVPDVLPVLWVMIHTSGQLIFPLTLVLIMLRTRTERGAISLGAFVNGWGYVISAAGPIVFGLLHSWSGSWQPPLIFLLVISLFCTASGFFLHSNRTLEDE